MLHFLISLVILVSLSGVPFAQHLTYYGGPVIPNVQVYTIFWTNEANNLVTYMNEINSFYRAITNSDYFDWLTEYDTTTKAIGRGSLVGSLSYTDPYTRTSLQDSDIQDSLKYLLGDGYLPSPSYYYAIHFAPGISITNQEGYNSCLQFCGYHGSGTLTAGNYFYYGVLPDQSASVCTAACGTSNVFNNLCSTSSHVLIETVTDPLYGVSTSTSTRGWYDLTNGEEIGDLCNLQQSTVQGSDDQTYTVQKLWSNRVGACITDTCDDGDPCTADLVSSTGVCSYLPSICDDDNPCTIDSVCNSKTGCSYTLLTGQISTAYGVITCTSGFQYNCFSGDNVITLEDGNTKSMKDLILGDSIPVWDENSGNYSYSPIVLFGLQNTGDTANFTTFCFDVGTGKRVGLSHMQNCISLTNFHAVQRNDGTFVWAHQVNIGDVLAGGFIVQNVAKTQGESVVAPITLDGSFIALFNIPIPIFGYLPIPGMTIEAEAKFFSILSPQYQSFCENSSNSEICQSLSSQDSHGRSLFVSAIQDALSKQEDPTDIPSFNDLVALSLSIVALHSSDALCFPSCIVGSDYPRCLGGICVQCLNDSDCQQIGLDFCDQAGQCGGMDMDTSEGEAVSSTTLPLGLVIGVTFVVTVAVIFLIGGIVFLVISRKRVGGVDATPLSYEKLVT